MYTHTNYKTKKALKDAVAAGEKVTYFQPGPFGGDELRDGKIQIEGPHFPKAHTWYAECTVENGYITNVK